MPLIGKPSGASDASASGAWLPSPYGVSVVEVLSSAEASEASTASVLEALVSAEVAVAPSASSTAFSPAVGPVSSAGATTAQWRPVGAATPATRRARSASAVTVFSATSSMTAIGALSPLRGSVLMMRV